METILLNTIEQKIQRAVDIMKRKTYNNVLKAAKLIQAKGYSEKESLEIAVQKFDELTSLKNGMSVEWLIDRMATKTERDGESMKLCLKNGYMRKKI